MAARRRSRSAPGAASAARTQARGNGPQVVGRGESGAVTAETAVALPVLLAIALGSTWLVALAATKVRVVDAAREVARVAARGEDDGAAAASGRQVAPAGTRFTVSRHGDQVVVVASVPVEGPAGLFRFLPTVEVRSEAVAAEEPR